MGNNQLLEKLEKLRDVAKDTGAPISAIPSVPCREFEAEYFDLLEMYNPTQNDTREEYEACLKRHVTQGHYSQEKAEEYMAIADEAHRIFRPWTVRGHGSEL